MSDDNRIGGQLAREVPERIRKEIEAKRMKTETAMRRRLKDHFLAEIVCDHERKMDNPVCACSEVHLGWHPSVGEAVDAWIDHVLEESTGGEHV